MTAALVERDRSRAGAARRGSKSRPKLKVLNQQAIRQRARRRHALVALFIVVLLGFFAVAFVHAELVADQQELDGIRTRIAEAEAYQAKVERAAEEASSPSAIVNRAQELGMVRANQPVFLAAAAPVRDVPTAISFRSSQTVTAVGVAAGDGNASTISVGISGVAPVTVAATPELATPAADVEGSVVEVDAAAGNVATDTEIQTQPAAIAQPVQTPTVVGTTASAGATASTGAVTTPAPANPVVATAAATTPEAATSGASASTPAPAPSTGGQSLGGASVEQAPTSIAGTTAVVGGAGTPSSGEEVGNSRFGGMSAGTGSG